MDVLLLALGLLAFWIGTEVTVHSAIRISDYFGWSQVFVGMTILAFGTDLPELVVAIRGSINNLQGVESSGLIVGNAIGSSVAQLGIVAGTIAIFSAIRLGDYHLPVLTIQLGGSVLILFLAIAGGTVNRLEGAVLLVFFLLYLWLLFDRHMNGDKREEKPIRHVWPQFVVVVAGLGLVVFAADLVLTRALVLSEQMGIRQSFFGAVIIGLGTSLPELGISLNAAWKKRSGLSLGNLVGSNIFDCLVPVGVAACISPLAVDATMVWFDTPFLAFLTAVFLLCLYFRSKLGRREGIILVVLYLVFVGIQFYLANLV